jgi:hypothetical protein
LDEDVWDSLPGDHRLDLTLPISPNAKTRVAASQRCSKRGAVLNRAGFSGELRT